MPKRNKCDRSSRKKRKNRRSFGVQSLSARTSPATAELIFLILEWIIILLTLASIIAFGAALWVASMDLEKQDPDWFLDSEIYWNGAIFGLTLAAVLLVFAASEKHLAQREQLANEGLIA